MTIENEAAVEAEGTPVSENTESSVTDAEVETPEGEEAQADEESTTSESDEEEKPKKKGGFQRRIDELTRKNYEAQREAEAYKAQLAQYQQQVQQQQMQNDAVPPKLADYNYDETAYYQAVQDWNESQIKRFQESQQQQAEQQRQYQERIRANQAMQEKMIKAQEKYPDFAAKINNPELPPLAQINSAAYQAVIDSDAFDDVAYYLASNPSEVYHFSSLSPIRAVKEVARLEAKLSAKPAAPAAPITPPSTVKPRAESVKDPDSMGVDEWMEYRNSQIQR